MHRLRRPFVTLALLGTLTSLLDAQGMRSVQSMHSGEPRATRPNSTAEHRAGAQVPFNELDQVRGDAIDLVFAPVRPMALGAEGRRLYAVNSHDSTVVEFRSEGRQRTISVPWGPVSLALVEAHGSARPDTLLVVCRGSYTLACIDLESASITRLVELPAEPADIVIHPTSGHAFVSCSGAGRVVEVDWVHGRIRASYPIPAMRPTFLTLDGEDVLVSPMLSGNNSIASGGSVVDLEDPTRAVKRLNDHDLFRITGDGQVLPVATDMGTILFASGINPATGELWQLGTEAKNKGPKSRGEPTLRGDFLSNRVSIASLEPDRVVAPARVIELDDADPYTSGVQFDRTRSVGQPYALSFDSRGNAYVAGLLSANVTQLSKSGEFVREWDVGAIPRAVLVDPAGAYAYVYSWGDNRVERYELDADQAYLSAALSVGFDPTPEMQKAGRKLFFDASFSMHGNVSCASCHVETETDMLAWDLSDLPFDDKGPLVTQTLRGIGDQFPLHWRGERKTLRDFNAAFDALLGGTRLDTTPGGEFDQFEAYVKSLEQPANPGTPPNRMVDADHTGNGGDAIRGQDEFFNAVGENCVSCHATPTGTSNEPMLSASETEGLERRQHMVVPSFNGLWRKEQPTLETVSLTNGRTSQRPTNGSGLLSAGASPNLRNFLTNFFQLGPQQVLDVEAFLRQLDSGLAPVVHRAWLLNESNVADVEDELQNHLLVEAKKGNADIAVFGTLQLDADATPMRWFWDRGQELFVPENSSLPARTLTDFLDAARANRVDLVFMGLPVGKAERIGVDADGDELFNQDERRYHCDPLQSDTDGDGLPDGHEVKNGGDPSDPELLSVDDTFPTIQGLRTVFTTSKIAKLQFRTDEPCRVSATWSSGAQLGSVDLRDFEKEHSIHLAALQYGRVYNVTVSATDLGGNRVTQDLTARAVSSRLPTSIVLRKVSTQVQQNSGGTLRFSMTGEAGYKVGSRKPGLSQLDVDVFVNGAFRQNRRGSISGNDGITTVDITLNGLSPGDEVRVVVQGLGGMWNMPETLPVNRERSLTYDGNGP